MPPVSTNILLSNHLEHILFQRFIILVRNPHLFSCIFQPLHLLKFFLRILKSNMGVNIKCHGNIRMPHEVLQCLRIHARFRHVTDGSQCYQLFHSNKHLQSFMFIFQTCWRRTAFYAVCGRQVHRG